MFLDHVKKKNGQKVAAGVHTGKHLAEVFFDAIFTCLLLNELLKYVLCSALDEIVIFFWSSPKQTMLNQYKKEIINFDISI